VGKGGVGMVEGFKAYAEKGGPCFTLSQCRILRCKGSCAGAEEGILWYGGGNGLEMS